MTHQKSVELSPQITTIIAAQIKDYDTTSFASGMRFMAEVMSQMAGEPKETVQEVASTFLQCLQIVEIERSITDEDQRSSSIS
jgi:hypothetical protein